MELKNIFKMIKTDHYTQDGRDQIAKLQETEDVKYKTGDISQKTGLQKQPDGSWAPPKNAGKNVHGAEIDKIYEKHQKRIKELKAKGYTDEQIENDKIYQQTKEDMRNVGKKTESKPGRDTPLLKNKDHVDLAKEVKSNTMPGSDWTAEEIAKEWKLGKADAEEVKKEFDKIKESKPDAAEQRDQIGTEIKESLEAARYYLDKANSFYPSDPSYKTYMEKAKKAHDEAKAQADDNGFYFEEMHDPRVTRAIKKYSEGNKPVDKEKLLDTLSFDLVDTTADIEEEYNAVEHSDNSRLPEFVRQEIEREYVNKTNGEKWTDEEKDIIAEEVTRRIKQRQSKDAAPRQLTGDCKIRVRKA